MKASLAKSASMGMEFTFGTMARSMKGTGPMEGKMGLEFIANLSRKSILKGSKNMEFG